MFISELKMIQFRQFRDMPSMKLGKMITAISGYNGTGKSTILAMLANSAKLYKKIDKPILQSQYNVELSQIIQATKDQDVPIPNVFSINLEDRPEDTDYPQELFFRATWQKGANNNSRYRVIPKKTLIRRTEKKLTLPVIYLGLSRLYPFGEVDDLPKILKSRTNQSDDLFVCAAAKQILQLNEELNEYKTLSSMEVKKKKAFGFNTDIYSYLCNSAGQDNLGQILMAILSFKKTKEKMGDAWIGGILLIDEIDATLHPAAQIRLINFLIQQSRQLGLQIIFTTHSLSLLRHICIKTDHNVINQVNNCEIIYLDNSNNALRILQTPKYNIIKHDLMSTYEHHQETINEKVMIFTEDEEARKVLKAIIEDKIPDYIDRFDFFNNNFGNTQLLKLLEQDPNNFSRYIFVLDGDVSEQLIASHISGLDRDLQKIVVKLPGQNRPEQVLYEYLMSLVDEPDHQLISHENGSTYSLRAIESSGPMSDKYNGLSEERDKYKQWFRDNAELINDTLPFWIATQTNEIDSFINTLINAYNQIAKLDVISI